MLMHWNGSPSSTDIHYIEHVLSLLILKCIWQQILKYSYFWMEGLYQSRIQSGYYDFLHDDLCSSTIGKSEQGLWCSCTPIFCVSTDIAVSQIFTPFYPNQEIINCCVLFCKWASWLQHSSQTPIRPSQCMHMPVQSIFCNIRTRFFFLLIETTNYWMLTSYLDVLPSVDVALMINWWLINNC